jgi:hypothetical protein
LRAPCGCRLYCPEAAFSRLPILTHDNTKQGSVASTLLCSLYLSDLEERHLLPLLPQSHTPVRAARRGAGPPGPQQQQQPAGAARQAEGEAADGADAAGGSSSGAGRLTALAKCSTPATGTGTGTGTATPRGPGQHGSGSGSGGGAARAVGPGGQLVSPVPESTARAGPAGALAAAAAAGAAGGAAAAAAAGLEGTPAGFRLAALPLFATPAAPVFWARSAGNASQQQPGSGGPASNGGGAGGGGGPDVSPVIICSKASNPSPDQQQQQQQQQQQRGAEGGGGGSGGGAAAGVPSGGPAGTCDWDQQLSQTAAPGVESGSPGRPSGGGAAAAATGAAAGTLISDATTSTDDPERLPTNEQWAAAQRAAAAAPSAGSQPPGPQQQQRLHAQRDATPPIDLSPPGHMVESQTPVPFKGGGAAAAAGAGADARQRRGGSDGSPLRGFSGLSQADRPTVEPGASTPAPLPKRQVYEGAAAAVERTPVMGLVAARREEPGGGDEGGKRPRQPSPPDGSVERPSQQRPRRGGGSDDQQPVAIATQELNSTGSEPPAPTQPVEGVTASQQHQQPEGMELDDRALRPSQGSGAPGSQRPPRPPSQQQDGDGPKSSAGTPGGWSQSSQGRRGGGPSHAGAPAASKENVPSAAADETAGLSQQPTGSQRAEGFSGGSSQAPHDHSQATTLVLSQADSPSCAPTEVMDVGSPPGATQVVGREPADAVGAPPAAGTSGEPGGQQQQQQQHAPDNQQQQGPDQPPPPPSRQRWGDSVLIRLVDDFLLVTTSRAAAEAVALRLQRGFLEDYNATVNPAKTRASFPLPLAGGGAAAPGVWRAGDG